MANVIASMGQGNGLLDRFVVYVPKSFRLIPKEQIAAKEMLFSMQVKETLQI